MNVQLLYGNMRIMSIIKYNKDVYESQKFNLNNLENDSYEQNIK